MPTLREWLKQEPFTLSMSSGYFSFFAHCGLLSVLEQEKIYPAKIAGASAGALAGVCWASGCSAERLKNILFSFSKKDIWDPTLGLGLLKGKLFRQFVAKICPVSKLEHCRIPVVISAFNLLTRTNHVFESGSLCDTVYASCCVPLLFQPIRIGQGFYIDGGITDRPGLAGVPTDDRIFYHHILDQWPLRWKTALLDGMPYRTNMVTITMHGLEPVGLLRLQKGRIAFCHAYQRMSLALDKNIGSQSLHV